jgi:hypothetical protein
VALPVAGAVTTPAPTLAGPAGDGQARSVDQRRCHGERR